MQSFLIIGKQKNQAKDYALEKIKERKISAFDITTIESEKTIGIPDIRLMQEKIYFKPLQGNEKAVIIDAFLGITPDAQNSLLKLLEEPPNNTVIFTLAKSKEEILPTIISRCTVIELSKKDISKEEKTKYQDLFEQIKSAGIGERLKLAQDIAKDKEECLLFLEEFLMQNRKNLIEKPNNPENLKTLKNIQEIYTIVNTSNANLRLAVENLFLNL